MTEDHTQNQNQPPARPPDGEFWPPVGRIVAELGRPETAEEAAARKASATASHRANQTVRNLVLSLLASLAVVLALVLVAVQPNLSPRAPIDYRAIAASAQVDASRPLASPVLPKGWAANAAQIRPSATGKTVDWYIGFITPSRQFIGMSQGILAGPSWTAAQLAGHAATSAITIGTSRWSVYDYRTNPGRSANLAYAMSTSTASGSIVLYGTGTVAEFRTLVRALETQLGGGQ
ncbi:MAG: DUF4245 family protein [Microbacteriaceae bacterium]